MGLRELSFDANGGQSHLETSAETGERPRQSSALPDDPRCGLQVRSLIKKNNGQGPPADQVPCLSSPRILQPDMCHAVDGPEKCACSTTPANCRKPPQFHSGLPEFSAAARYQP